MIYPTAPPGSEEGRMDAKDECHLLFVPVRESGSGVLALRTGRLPSGQRVGAGLHLGGGVAVGAGPRPALDPAPRARYA
jgi:hypothetical protein